MQDSGQQNMSNVQGEERYDRRHEAWVARNNHRGALGARRLESGTELPEGRGRFFGMNKLAVGTGRWAGIGGRFFGAPSLVIRGSPELDIFVVVVGTAESGGTDTVGEVSGDMRSL